MCITSEWDPEALLAWLSWMGIASWWLELERQARTDLVLSSSSFLCFLLLTCDLCRKFLILSFVWFIQKPWIHFFLVLNTLTFHFFKTVSSSSPFLSFFPSSNSIVCQLYFKNVFWPGAVHLLCHLCSPLFPQHSPVWADVPCFWESFPKDSGNVLPLQNPSVFVCFITYGMRLKYFKLCRISFTWNFLFFLLPALYRLHCLFSCFMDKPGTFCICIFFCHSPEFPTLK